jgi:DNA-binding LytR/AlgR family response regulator
MKILVVDDEPLARRRLIRKLRALADAEVVGEAADGNEAAEKITALAPDLVFLDIRMPGLDGMALARQLASAGEGGPAVIFTTAHSEHAVEAFELAAADYLLKPVETDRLRTAFDKVKKAMGPKAPADPSRLAALVEKLLRAEGNESPPRVSARLGDVVHIFDAREIARFHAEEKYVVVRKGGEEYLLDESLQTLEQRLAPHGFLRVHRSDLVNLASVRALRLEGDGEGAVLDLSDGQQSPVSRRMLAEVKIKLGLK